MGKKGDWSSFLKEFLENIENEDFGFDIFLKCQIWRPFTGLAPSKLKFVSQKIKGRLCVYRGIV